MRIKIKHQIIFYIFFIALFSEICNADNQQPNNIMPSEDMVSLKIASPYLTEYIKLALKYNPKVTSAFHLWQSELKNIPAAQGLPDPTINFGYFLENIETAVGPQEWKIGFMQMIPWPGKLIIQGDIQSLKAEAAYQRLQTLISKVIYQVQVVYLDAYFLDRSIATTRENITLVEQWENIILTKFKSGSARHPDLIKTQIEAIKLEDDLATLEAGRLPILEKFRALLNVDTLQKITYPESLPSPEKRLDKETFRHIVSKNNPNLNSFKKLQGAADKSVIRAKLNWLPDFSVGMDFINTGNKWMNGTSVPESGKDPWIIMGSVSLPLWGYKQASQVRSAKEQAIAEEALVMNIINTLKVDFENAWFEYENAERKYDLYKNRLLPKSLESLKTTQKAYISNQMDFLSLVDTQRRHLDFTLATEKATINFYKSIAQLQKLAGRSL